MNVLALKAYVLRVVGAYPLGFVVLSVHCGWVLLALLTHSPAAPIVFWDDLCLMVVRQH
ncbi:hypothetical protein [uncultured Helicobacter sp.]|uniref:hypothetical protein n=1 Tax=uncultured Helicobacter sp. TaxID=175537 RepID=UPI003752F136